MVLNRHIECGFQSFLLLRLILVLFSLSQTIPYSLDNKVNLLCMLLMYVDDVLIASDNQKRVGDFKALLD